MPIPSLHVLRDQHRKWSVGRAAAYGAGIGALAALFKAQAPFHGPISRSLDGVLFTNAVEILGAAACFALLCAGAAALRNLIARHLIWPKIP